MPKPFLETLADSITAMILWMLIAAWFATFGFIAWHEWPW